MLLLQRLLSSSTTSPVFPLQRLLSATAPRISPNPSFAVEDYLVANCGLTPAQALKASQKLSHLKSPTNPDAVLAFLAGLGLSSADVAAVVAKDPKFLCAAVERTLAPIALELTAIGLSRSEVVRLISLTPDCFRSRSIVSKLPYYQSLFGSYEKLFRVLNYRSNLLGRSLEKVVKPNVAFLHECGLGACDIASLALSARWILGAKPESVRAMAARAESLGVPRGSGMFKQALHAVSFRSEVKIAAKVEFIKNTFRLSDAEVGIAICKSPMVLALSKDTLQRKSEFLISEVGLEPAYITRHPVMLGLSLEGRLKPRYYVLKFLKGLLNCERDYSYAVKLTEKAFMKKLICPHKEGAPYLAEDYASACSGEKPTRFRFT